MTQLNEMRLAFPSRSANESFARAAAACFVAQLDPTLEELGDIKTAVSEAVTNCIVHAYPDRIGEVTLRCALLAEGRVRITVSDRGTGIPDVARAMEPAFTTGGEERSGMGFTIMQSFMDRVRVRSRVGRGTTVVMEKTLSPRGAAAGG